MIKPLATTLALALTIAAATAQLRTPPQARPQTNKEDPSYQLQKFGQFFTYLNLSYVDTLNNKKLVEKAIEQVLLELDPHSAYITESDMKQVNESFDGSFSGIGIEFNVLNDTVIVVNTIVGGPAEKTGMAANDRITVIDGKSAVGMKQNEVPSKLRGPKGSAVEIEVVRRGEPAPLSFRIVRDNIPMTSVDAAYKLSPSTGYVKVNRFAHTTASEFNVALDKLGRIDALVLDLRGNGGGLLDQAVAMSQIFLPKGAEIVSTEGRMVGSEKYRAQANGRFMKGRLVVLIDESSASASEIVCGAVQDWDRGLIVGSRSFGKGLVQKQFPLLDGSSVRITVARYHTPTGRVIQNPFEMGHKEDYYRAHYERYDQHALDTVPGMDSLKYRTLRKGRTVYGGGGIYPDVNVPSDTTWYSPYLAKLVRRGVLNEFVISYMDANRKALEEKYRTYDDFEKGFTMDKTMSDALVALGEKRSVPADSAGMQTSGNYIATVIKAAIAQKLWSLNEYYRTLNSAGDPVVKEAMDILDNWERRAKPIL